MGIPESDLHQLMLRLGDRLAPTVLRGRIGLEKETLRVQAAGSIAQTPHPAGLGSALTHPYITTDYSEALLELVTPPFDDVRETLGFLQDLQAFAAARVGDEILWATSMPCAVSGEDSIPVAQYGHSNAGRMKTVYRIGLGHRYGRLMQVIAGVHFNYSPQPALWPVLADLRGATDDREFRDQCMMGMIRNLLRFGWLVPYLFGASPAVCNTFLDGRGAKLEDFDDDSSYLPLATSLRMGDIGYNNRKEADTGIKANYNSLAEYVDSLRCAITTESSEWARIGVKVNGDYRQLNANILQIENEYYSSVRPKQPLERFEKPTDALESRGIAYVELRSVDVNAQHPLGVDESQLRFLEAFCLTALLIPSAPLSESAMADIDANLLAVAHYGRKPGLMLRCERGPAALQDLGREILTLMRPVAAMLDQGLPGDPYRRSLSEQWGKVEQAALTPSARMLEDMMAREEGFYRYARRLSDQHREAFRSNCPLPREAELVELAQHSLTEQTAMEASDRYDFDSFLQRYFDGSLVGMSAARSFIR
ncbi:Glutamate--cysteine ligase [Thioalkalivibrio nitratireducens DSM 14787]|uniref:Glutamate--cysteine ligase n=2 Tax=Thioalkalivibrio nitratireducens TaxID=186931 RepID=L0DSM5_THIND|nr:glutamate--cysteine ligase [Thioalkalivibrio nitratireducens]AGA31985.1 Glutamate--cysteine ligase [Thioalkalivibrio nitratireducens DSM 14787]